MLATAAPGPFDSPTHLFEVKWDGWRCLAYLDACTRLYSRNGNPLTARFPELSSLHQQVHAPAVLDGELVAMVGGRPQFSRALAGKSGLIFVAFDLLQLDGMPLLERPLEERRALLGQTLRPGPRAVLSEAVPARGLDLFQAVRERGMEGVVAKALGTPYVPGRRTQHWLKVTHRRRMDCVICGYQPGMGAGLGSLALGVYAADAGLVYIGHTGTGISWETARELLATLAPTAASPLRHVPRDVRGVRWVQPELVCEVAYLELTPEGRLRHASFKGLRPDKDPHECRAPGEGGA